MPIHYKNYCLFQGQRHLTSPITNAAMRYTNSYLKLQHCGRDPKIPVENQSRQSATATNFNHVNHRLSYTSWSLHRGIDSVSPQCHAREAQCDTELAKDFKTN